MTNRGVHQQRSEEFDWTRAPLPRGEASAGFFAPLLMNMNVVKAVARPTGAKQEMLLSGHAGLSTGSTKILRSTVGAILRGGHKGTSD